MPVALFRSRDGETDRRQNNFQFVENDLGAQRTLAANREQRRDQDAQTLGDITQLSPERLLKAAGLGRGDAILLAGGPPCQSFSTAGRRASVSDPRGGLFTNFVTMGHAPNSITAVEALIEAAIGQGKVTRVHSDELLTALTEAYKEAASGRVSG